VKVTRNDYKINDWLSFLSKPIQGTFYSIDKSEFSNRVRTDRELAARITLNGDYKINVFEANIMNFLEVLGTIGGIYEILYLASTFFLKINVRFITRHNLVQKLHNEIQNNSWFSYPSSISKSQAQGKRKKKIENLELDKSDANIDRKRNYEEQPDIEVL